MPCMLREDLLEHPLPFSSQLHNNRSSVFSAMDSLDQAQFFQVINHYRHIPTAHKFLLAQLTKSHGAKMA